MYQIWLVYPIGKTTPKQVKARSRDEAIKKSGIYPTLVGDAFPKK